MAEPIHRWPEVIGMEDHVETYEDADAAKAKEIVNNSKSKR